MIFTEHGCEQPLRNPFIQFGSQMCSQSLWHQHMKMLATTERLNMLQLDMFSGVEVFVASLGTDKIIQVLHRVPATPIEALCDRRLLTNDIISALTQPAAYKTICDMTTCTLLCFPKQRQFHASSVCKCSHFSSALCLLLFLLKS
jgi:hypothetical protein